MYYSLKATYPGFESVSRNSRTRKSCLNKMIEFMIHSGDVEPGMRREKLSHKQDFVESCDYKLVRHKNKKGGDRKC